MVFPKIKAKANELHVTFEEIAAEPDFQLTGWRKFLGIRKREQKAEIRSRVNEINKAYDAFKKETEDVSSYLTRQIWG